MDVHSIADRDKCPVCIILRYLSLIPKTLNCKALYLKPCVKFHPGYWYFDRHVGSNKLSEVVKELCKKAGLPGFYSNNSLRSKCATNLHQNDVDEHLIQEITGHRSLAQGNV